MRTYSSILRTTLALLVLATAVPARAAGLRVLATDANGVTLRLDVGDWSLSAPDADGRQRIVGVPDAHSLADPGHGLLPAWSTMLAVPLDARPSVRVIARTGAAARDDVRLAIAMKPTFVKRAGSDEYEPIAEVVEPLTDGPWPMEAVRLGTPTAFRGRRLVGIELRPFQYDDAEARLAVTTGMTVRVDFNRPAVASLQLDAAYAPDPHADATLASSVLNFEQARAWRAAPLADPAVTSLFAASRAARLASGAEANAFDESEAEVRVQLDSTGLYLLPYDELVSKGYPAGVPIAQVSVHRHEFDEGATVPYHTVDVPVEVDDPNHNGVFDSGDQVWVYARTWAERSGVGPRQRQWGDAEMIFVTRRNSGGARLPQRSGWRGQSGLTPLASYPYFRHWEQNWTRMMPIVTLPADTALDLFQWTDFTQYDVHADTIQFAVSEIDTSHTVTVQTQWMGRASNTHYAWASVKNPVGNEALVANGDFWFGKRPFLSSATIPGGSLREGNNRFVTWGRTDPSVITLNAGLNWFETTYWRRFRAVHDEFTFNSAGAEGEIQIHGDSFSSDSIRVWDVTAPESPVRVVLDPAHVAAGAFDLQDLVATGTRHEYVAASPGDPPTPGYGPMVPPSSAFTPVRRHPLDAIGEADYVVVVGDSTWLAAVQPLATLRASQGLSVLVTTTQELYDQFNGGRHSAAALQRFARYAYTRWSSRFLLFVGDGTLDPLNRIGNAGKDWVPVLSIPGPVSVPEGFEITVSDNAYGCLTGNCDPIFGGGDVIPELMIGRLPANSLTDVQNMVSKIVNYETFSGDQTWRSHVVLLADDAYSSDLGFGVGGGGFTYCWKSWEEYFVGLNRKVRSVMVDEGGLSHMDIERFNLRYYVTTGYRANNSYGDTCRVDRNATRTLVHNSVSPVLFSHLNSGTLWMNFQGHANEYVLTHEDLYVNNGDVAGSDDKWLFRNPGKPILWTAFSCHANMFARGEGGPRGIYGGCLGEDMMTLANAGAVATWASTCYEIVPRDDSTHLNVAFARAMFSAPPVDPQVSGSRVVLGEAIQAAFVRYLPSVANNGSERGTSLTYTLLGDPAQRISIGRPQTVVRANDTLVVDQVPVKLHSPLDTLTLVADLISTVRIDSVRLYRRVNGTETRIALDSTAFAPAFPDTAGGGVTGGRRYRVTYHDQLLRHTYAYVYRTTDHDGLDNTFTVLFELASSLKLNGVPLSNGTAVMPNAQLTLEVASPAPIDPNTDLVLTVGGTPQSFTFTPAHGDASGREWTLSWTHANYAQGRYDVALAVAGGDTLRHAFQVSNQMAFRDLIAFPNPFDNDGTRFSFNLVSPDLADVHITVFTVSGRKVWSGEWPGTTPGYHQFPWDGRDADGDALANGTYLINATAVTASGQRTQQYGRIVKLRKPRHVDVPDPGAPTP